MVVGSEKISVAASQAHIMTQLSETVQKLIAKSRIVSFKDWESTHPPEAIAIFQAADDRGDYLTDQDLQQIQELAPEMASLIPLAKLLRDHAPQIVDSAREQVLQQFSGITESGGELYPPERAEACWRDFWHFLRCITYGIAGQRTDYTSPEGLTNMQKLYQELKVPLEAMVFGLINIKTASQREIEPELHSTLNPYFEHLITQLRHFQT